MNTPGNAVNLVTAHKNRTKLSVPCCDRTYNTLVSVLLSQNISPLFSQALKNLCSSKHEFLEKWVQKTRSECNEKTISQLQTQKEKKGTSVLLVRGILFQSSFE